MTVVKRKVIDPALQPKSKFLGSGILVSSRFLARQTNDLSFPEPEIESQQSLLFGTSNHWLRTLKIKMQRASTTHWLVAVAPTFGPSGNMGNGKFHQQILLRKTQIIDVEPTDGGYHRSNYVKWGFHYRKNGGVQVSALSRKQECRSKMCLWETAKIRYETSVRVSSKSGTLW